jgi:hypothetical protein
MAHIKKKAYAPEHTAKWLQHWDYQVRANLVPLSGVIAGCVGAVWPPSLIDVCIPSPVAAAAVQGGGGWVLHGSGVPE